MNIEKEPIYKRPYEKFQQYGVQALTDVELLAIFLRVGTKECNVVELSNQLLSAKNDPPKLIGIHEYTYEELCQIKGIGKVKAMQLIVLKEIGKRISKQKYTNSIRKMNSPKQVAEYFMEELRYQKEEKFVIAMLDTKCKLIGQQLISKGSLTSSIVHPREVFKIAIQKSAYSIVAVHNHPSGDPTPSKQDIEITRQLQKAGILLGIDLLDHVVIGDGQYKSLKEEGYFSGRF